MASEGPNNPGTMADDATIGISAWSNPDNAKGSDNVDTSVFLTSGTCNEYEIKIVKSDGSIGAENKSTGAILPGTDTYISYGSSSDLWSETWSSTDINDVDFGFVISYYISSAPTRISHYLKATNLGFSIPGGATINGIIVEVERKQNSSGTAKVDHIRITVDYTSAPVPKFLPA